MVVYVIGLSEMGGCWIPSPTFYTDFDLALAIMERRRAKGANVQLFTFYSTGMDEIHEQALRYR